MKKITSIILLFLSFNLLANEEAYKCSGRYRFGLNGHKVSISSLKHKTVATLVVETKKGEILIDEPVKVKADYINSSLMNLHGLGVRELDISGFIDISDRSGFLLIEDKEMNLKDCN